MTHSYSARSIRRAIRSADPSAVVTVEQTGGGTATIYVGEYDHATGRAWLSVGPGSYNWSDPWASRFHREDLSVGPDDDGYSPSGYPATLADLSAYVASHCQCRGCASVSAYSHGQCAACLEHGVGPHVEPTE